MVGDREGEREAAPTWALQDVKRGAMRDQDKTHPTLELGCNFTVPWRMMNPNLTGREHRTPSPKGGELTLLTGAVHGVGEARKEGAFLLLVSTLPTFLCAASSSQGSLSQSNQERREGCSAQSPRLFLLRVWLS